LLGGGGLIGGNGILISWSTREKGNGSRFGKTSGEVTEKPKGKGQTRESRENH